MNGTADFSEGPATSLAKAGWPVINVASKEAIRVLTFATANNGREVRVVERHAYPALHEYARECVNRLRPAAPSARPIGSHRPGKTARDKASKTRGKNQTGHGAIAGPQKGAPGSTNKGNSKKGKH